MTDYPIIMSGPMVRALLEGRKSQTRRLAWRSTKWNPDIECKHGRYACPICDGAGVKPTIWQKVKAGDRLWIRETHTFESSRDFEWYDPPFNDGRPLRVHDDPDWGQYWDQAHYRATDPTPDLAYDDQDEPGVRWRPSIHMPRWASRITLAVDSTRVERLQEISIHDAAQEGMHSVMEQRTWWYNGVSHVRTDGGPKRFPTSVAAYHALWDHLHGPDSWQANPEVVAIGFTPRLCNIDEMGGNDG